MAPPTSGSDDETVVYSDEEQPDPPTWEQAQDFQLVFGKYQGRKMKSMLLTGKRRHYLRYLMKWDKLLPQTGVMIQCALDHYEELKNEHQKESQSPPAKKAKVSK
jgi:hypothetical protein